MVLVSDFRESKFKVSEKRMVRLSIVVNKLILTICKKGATLTQSLVPTSQ